MIRPGSALAVPAFTTGTSTNTGANPSSSFSWSINNTATGSTTDIGVVCLTVRNGTNTTISTVTWGGVPMTQLSTANNSTVEKASIWYTLNPPDGSKTISVSATGTAGRWAAAALVYSGVDQTTPFGTAVTGIGSTTNATVSIASASTERALACIGKQNSSESNLTPGSKATQRAENHSTNSTASNNSVVHTNDEVGASSVAVNATWPSTSRQWAMVGVGLKPAPTPYSDADSHEDAHADSDSEAHTDFDPDAHSHAHSNISTPNTDSDENATADSNADDSPLPRRTVERVRNTSNARIFCRRY